MRPIIGIVRGIELKAPPGNALDLQGPGERNVLAPLGNGPLGDPQLSGDLRPGTEVIYYIECTHVPKFSALDTECKTARPLSKVRYSPMNETRGQRIRYLRRSKGMTQQQLADRLGVSKGLVSQWEKDQISEIKHSNWMALLQTLQTTAEFLQFGPDLPRQGSGEGARIWRKTR